MACSFLESQFIDFRLHVLLAGKRHLCKALSEAMHVISHRFNVNLEIHLALDLSTIVTGNFDFSFDFIVIVHDIRERMSEFPVDFFKEQLQYVDHHYRTAQRLAIALPLELKTSDSSTKYGNLFSEAIKYGLPVIRGDLNSPDAKDYMAERVLELIVSNTGANTGFPAPLNIF